MQYVFKKGNIVQYVEAKDKDEARKKFCKQEGWAIERAKNIFPCQFQLLAQRDKRWRWKRLKPSWLTVGSDGCLVTSISMFSFWGCADITPDELADNLEFTRGGYLLWHSINKFKKLKMEFVWRYYRYDREKIKSILYSDDHVCVVQVPFGSGRHWMAVVNYDKRKGFLCADPWTKKYVYASKYGNITGFAELKVIH